MILPIRGGIFVVRDKGNWRISPNWFCFWLFSR